MKKYYLTIAFSLFILYLIVDCTKIVKKEHGWWSGYYFIADWRDKPCDYSTNKVVHNFYNDKEALWYRHNKFEIDSTMIKAKYKTPNALIFYLHVFPLEVEKDLRKRKELIIGIDKYILSAGIRKKGNITFLEYLVPVEILANRKLNIEQRLMKGEVFRILVSVVEDNKISWQLIK